MLLLIMASNYIQYIWGICYIECCIFYGRDLDWDHNYFCCQFNYSKDWVFENFELKVLWGVGNRDQFLFLPKLSLLISIILWIWKKMVFERETKEDESLVFMNS